MSLYVILSHTPVWVWVLLAFLISRGITAMSPREVPAGRILIVPLVFLVWGLTGILGTDEFATRLALFAFGLVAGLAGGRALAALMPAPRRLPAGLLAIPGSPAPLILILLAFATKYAGSVALAMNPDAAVHTEISAAMAAVGGLFAGLFWGRTLGQFVRALQADGEPVTLGALVDLVAARSRGSAGAAR